MCFVTTGKITVHSFHTCIIMMLTTYPSLTLTINWPLNSRSLKFAMMMRATNHPTTQRSAFNVTNSQPARGIKQASINCWLSMFAMMVQLRMWSQNKQRKWSQTK